MGEEDPFTPLLVRLLISLLANPGSVSRTLASLFPAHQAEDPMEDFFLRPKPETLWRAAGQARWAEVWALSTLLGPDVVAEVASRSVAHWGEAAVAVSTAIKCEVALQAAVLIQHGQTESLQDLIAGPVAERKAELETLSIMVRLHGLECSGVPEALSLLGDSLQARGAVEAAGVCRLLSGRHEEDLGVDWLPGSDMRGSSWLLGLHLADTFEYLRRRQQPDFFFDSLFPLKVKFVMGLHLQGSSHPNMVEILACFLSSRSSNHFSEECREAVTRLLADYPEVKSTNLTLKAAAGVKGLLSNIKGNISGLASFLSSTPSPVLEPPKKFYFDKVAGQWIIEETASEPSQPSRANPLLPPPPPATLVDQPPLVGPHSRYVDMFSVRR
ncbi:MAG: hypothetical protein KVP17_004219 [Porospora cf. gigantea B]|uniref:uncharacterized protein n=1 Tax=Porospora cf. gigantea B TaxID=2853592 RepID=UPI003571F529|nr:MAG: hypothetical protein KVP17_004219 [Porospora cf. gigantea B]